MVRLATNDGPTADAYTSVLLQGSGACSMKSILTCVVSESGKLLILSNGAYGDRMAEIARYGRLRYEMLSFSEIEPVCPVTVDRFLSRHREITHVSFVHCETTTGIPNTLEGLVSRCL